MEMQDSFIPNFEQQIVLITGGSRGIGASISRLFDNLGAQLLIVYRSKEEDAMELLDELQGDHQIYQCDISDPAQVSDLIEDIEEEFGKIDICINNAGVGFHHPIDEVSYSQWQSSWKQIMDINLIGPANICHQVAQLMITQGSGKIINVSSRGAFRGEPQMAAYGASKAGLNSLTQSLAHALAQHNIFVGAIAPGFVETDMSRPRLEGSVGEAIKNQSPMNRVAHPDEVAQAVLLMAQSNQWMTGGIFDVNGASYFRT